MMIGSVVILAAAIVLSIIFLIPNDTQQSDDTVKSDITLTAEDKAETSALAKDVIKSFGTFGFITDQITGDNIMDVSYLVSQDPSNAENFFTSREDAYNLTKEKFIAAGSPMDYDSRKVTDWTNDFEINSLASFSVESVEATTQNKGSTVSSEDGTSRTIAIVNVTFTSREIQRNQTVNDSTWDGTWDVSQKDFNDKAVLNFVQTENGWQLYSMTGPTNAFLLSSWETPEASLYANTQFDFQKVGTLKTNIQAQSGE